MEKQEQNEQENPVIGIQRDKINKAWIASIEVNVFDAEKFIEEVWAKYVGTEHEVEITKLQELWRKVMAMPPQGDPSLCPYVPGEPHLAFMDIWAKAGDFWRAMYRVGDILYCDQYGHPLYNWMLGEKSIILQEKAVELERKLEHLNKKLEAFKADEREKQVVYQSEERNFIAVDFETATNDRMACQIGIAVVKDGAIVEQIVRYIRPPYNRYDFMCQRVHRITEEMTEHEPDFYQIWPELKHYFEETTEVWAHNAAFDRDVLMKNLLYAGLFEDLYLADKFHCTMKLYGGKKLKDLCKAFGMDASGHHDAGFDAKCCAQFRLNYLNGVPLSQ